MTVSFRPIAFLALAALLTPGWARAQSAAPRIESSPADSAPTAAPPTLPAWIAWGSAFTGVGFRDNVLLSHAGEERSGFVRGGFDATAWHVPHDRIDYLGVINAIGTRYFSAKTINHEEQVIALTTWRYRSGDVFRFSLDGSGAYSHLIYDVSDTDVQQVVAEIRRSGASLGPTVRWAFRPAWWIEAQGAARRETYPDGFNNRSIREGALRLGWRPGARFEASVAGLEWRRHYDRREQFSGSGRELAGTVLAIRERAAELRLKATLDAAAHWKTDTRASVARFADNGSGYLNYRERKIAHEVEWEAGDWHVEGEASARRVEFAAQTVGFGISPPARVRDAFLARLRIERKLTPRWTAYAEYTWERNRCNDPLASYVLNEGLLGVRWNWEK